MNELFSILLQAENISSYHRNILERNHDAAIDIVREVIAGARFRSTASSFDFKRQVFSENMAYCEIKKSVNNRDIVFSKNKTLSFLPGGLNVAGFWLVVSSLICSGYLKAVAIPKRGTDHFSPVHFELEATEKSQQFAEQETPPDIFVMTRAFIDSKNKEWKPDFKELKNEQSRVIRHFGYSDIIYRARSLQGQIVLLECVDDSGRQMMTDGITLEKNTLFTYEERQKNVHQYYHVVHPSQIAQMSPERSALNVPDMVLTTAHRLDLVSVELQKNRLDKQKLREKIKALQAQLADSEDTILTVNAIINEPITAE